MARRPSAPAARASAAKRSRPKVATPVAAPAATRVDRLVQVIDHCTAAKDIADEIGEKFLSYLLSMAIQETRAAMRRNPPPPNRT